MTISATARETYLTPRSQEDFDLVAACRQILIDGGLHQEVQTGFDNHPHILDASTRKPEVQRHILNQYWNLQLLATGANTFEVRYCLIPNGEISDWLRLFKDKVLPTAVQHRLPRAF